MTDILRQTTAIVDALQKLRDEALHYGRRITDNGKGIDDHQVHTERLAYLATEVEAARALVAYATGAQATVTQKPVRWPRVCCRDRSETSEPSGYPSDRLWFS